MTEEDRAAIAVWHSFKMAIEVMESERDKINECLPVLRRKLKECEDRSPHILPPRAVT